MQNNIKNEQISNEEKIKENNTYIAAELFSKLSRAEQKNIIDLIKSVLSDNK